jgi:hypothetical protein
VFGSLAPPRSAGPHLTLRHGSAYQVYNVYTRCCPRRVDGTVGARLRCRGPWWCSPSWPLDQSATIGTLGTSPSRMHPARQPSSGTPRNAKSGRDQAICGRAHGPQAQHRPSRPIRTLPSLPSSRNIYTAAVASPAPMGVGGVSSGRRGGRRLAGEGRRRHNPAQNEGQSCDDDQFETIDTPGDTWWMEKSVTKSDTDGEVIFVEIAGSRIPFTTRVPSVNRHAVQTSPSVSKVRKSQYCMKALHSQDVMNIHIQHCRGRRACPPRRVTRTPPGVPASACGSGPALVMKKVMAACWAGAGALRLRDTSTRDTKRGKRIVSCMSVLPLNLRIPAERETRDACPRVERLA